MPNARGTQSRAGLEVGSWETGSISYADVLFHTSAAASASVASSSSAIVGAWIDVKTNHSDAKGKLVGVKLSVLSSCQSTSISSRVGVGNLTEDDDTTIASMGER